MRGLFDYTPGSTLLHTMNPITKICLALCICIAAFASENLAFLLTLLAVDMAVGAIGNILPKAIRILTGLVKVSVFLFILQVLFIRDGNILFWIVTDAGVLAATRLVLRLIVACIPLALMLSVTATNDLTNALVKTAHVPYKYAFTFSTAVRFIPLFMDEMSGIIEAQTARGVDLDSGGFFKKMKLILPMCVPLLIISVRKIDGTAMAAEVRGFNLRTGRSGYKSYPFQAADMLTFLFCAVLIAAGIVL